MDFPGGWAVPWVCSAARVPQQRWHIVIVPCCCLCPSELCEPEERLPQARDVSVCPTASAEELLGGMCWRTKTMLQPHQPAGGSVTLCLIDTAVWTLPNCLPPFLSPGAQRILRDRHTARLRALAVMLALGSKQVSWGTVCSIVGTVERVIRNLCWEAQIDSKGYWSVLDWISALRCCLPENKKTNPCLSVQGWSQLGVKPPVQATVL